MTFFFRSSIESETLEPIFKKCLTSGLSKILTLEETLVTDEFLSQNFDFTTQDILEEYINDLHLRQIQRNEVEIVLDYGVRFHEMSLKSLIELLEYGNLELEAPHITKAFVQLGVTKLREEIGGI